MQQYERRAYLGCAIVRSVSVERWHDFDTMQNRLYVSIRFMPLSALDSSSGAHYKKYKLKIELDEDKPESDQIMDTLVVAFKEVNDICKTAESFRSYTEEY